LAAWEQSDAYAESFPAAYEFSFAEAVQEAVDDGKERRFAGFTSDELASTATKKRKDTNRTKDGYLIKEDKKKPRAKNDAFYEGELKKIEKFQKTKEDETTKGEESGSKTARREDSILIGSQTPRKKAKLG
jgi:hypothetical protein